LFFSALLNNSWYASIVAFSKKPWGVVMTKSNVKIITVANQKGGVGKTTTTMNIGSALMRRGKKVLFVDLDPQANLTSYLGVVPGVAPNENIKTIDEYFLSKRTVDDENISNQYLARTNSGADLFASDQALSGVEYYLFSRPNREKILINLFEPIKGNYDFILIDTPPSLNLLTLNAFCASAYVLVPVQPEFFSLEGIVKLNETINNVRLSWNPSLRLIGVLPNLVSKRRRLTKEVLQALGGEFASELLTTRIHDNVSIAESSGQARSVLDYRGSSIGAQEFLSAADEIINRCEVWGGSIND